ncbi:MAG TPA: ABC transporter substrate-binding protein [Candidatus Tectomicrobia bacterium]|nr:ABC transporter substrate-binding protein [Candidatus Tectomicrobia bacterium]
MAKRVHTSLLVTLWGCAALLILSPSAPTQIPASPDPGPQFGGIYRRMLANNPTTLDPALATDVYSGTVIRQLFDGLVQFDAHLNPLPALAEYWEASRDGRTWTFTLRQGATFHNGREVTAEDFVYSFSRPLDSQKPGLLTELLSRLKGADDFMQGRASHVEGLKAVDRYTLRLVLAEPLAPSIVLLRLSDASVVPREEVEKLGERFGHAPVGTGPFKFVRWEPHQELVLEANPQYHEGRPFLDAVIYKLGGKFEEEFAGFLQGHLEEAIVPSDRTDAVATAPQYQTYQLLRKPTLSLLYIGFNTQVKPFDDRRVRQAFNYAVNRQAIVQAITKMGSIPATGALPPGMAGHDPDFEGYHYDLDKAKRLLAEAGFPAGTGFPTVQLWSVSKAESAKAEMAAYQRYLADLGVRVEVHLAPDWPVYRDMLEQGKLSMFRLAWYADIPDPHNFLWPLLHSTSPTNRTFYRNPKVDRLLDDASTELDDALRVEMYREVERITIADAPWIAQHYHVLERIYQPYVKGVEVSLRGDRAIPMKKVWFGKSRTSGTTEATFSGHSPP